MEELLGIVMQFLAELILQVVWEFLYFFGAGSASKKVKPMNQGRALLLTSLISFPAGFVAGYLLSIFHHQPFLHDPVARWIYLFVSPLVAGYLLVRFGTWNTVAGVKLSSFGRFWSGASLAFGFAVARALITWPRTVA